MIGSSQGYEESFLDAQDITDYPIYNTSSSNSNTAKNTRKFKKDNLVKEELRLLRSIKNAVSSSKESHDRRKEKKFNEKKDKTQQRILEDLDELLKYIKKDLKKAKGGSIFGSILPEKRDRKGKIAGGLFSKGARKEAEAIEAAEKTKDKVSFFSKLGKGGKLLKYGGIGAGAAGLGVVGKNLYDDYAKPTEAKSERGIGRILESAGSGALAGGEFGSLFDGIGAIPGALIGGIGAGGVEAFSEYKDDITKGFSSFSKEVAQKAVSETNYVLGATAKEVSKFTQGRFDFDFDTSLDGLEKSLGEYKDKIEDTLISFWEKGIGYLEHNTPIPKIGKDVAQGAYRTLDKVENKVGVHASWEPDAVSAINDITKGPNAIDRDYAIAVAQLESTGGKNRGNSTSSAKGMYQVLDGTREDLAKQYHIDDSNPFNSETSAKLFQAYTKQNTPILEKSLGRAATDPEKYMSYVFGSGEKGAPTLIKNSVNNPNVIAADVMKKEAASNKGIFYDKKGKARTFKEVYDLIVNKYNNALKLGLSGMKIQEDRFGMNSAGTKKDLTKDVEATAKPVTDAIKRATNDVISYADQAKEKLVDYYEKTVKKDADEAVVTVKGKKHDLNIKPTWLQKNMPATANNWDSLKSYGRTANAFFNGSMLGTTDLSGGDRTFVNRHQYQNALDSNVSWLEKGSFKGDTVTRSPVDNSADNLKTDSLVMPPEGTGTLKERAAIAEKIIHRDAARLGVASSSGSNKNNSSDQDLNSSKIDIDSVPMFLQDNGIILINSGRGT